MHPRPVRLLHLIRPTAATCLVAALAPVFSQTPPVPDPAKLLDQLDKLEESVKKARTGQSFAAVDTIREAATSDQKALALWIDCVHEVDFRDKDKKEADFRGWREDAGKKLAEPGAAGALRLNLHYLVLTIRAATVKTESERADLLGSVLSFLDELPKAGKDVLRRREALDNPVLATPVARRFRLDATVKPAIEWAPNAGDIAGIYETSILPFLRQKKDSTKLQAAWNRRIQQEAAVVAVQDSEFLTKTFREITLPTLEWGQACDLFRAGTASSVAKLFQLIQQNQTHKDAPAWIAELKGLLGEKVDAPAGVASVASAEPTTPPEAATTLPPELPPSDDSAATPPEPVREVPRAPLPVFPPNLRR